MTAPYLDPLPTLLTLQFDGEDPKFVPGGGAIFTEPQMNHLVAKIAYMVRKKGRSGTLRWEEASGGIITKHAMVLSP